MEFSRIATAFQCSILAIVLAGCGGDSRMPGGVFDAGPLFASSTPTLTHLFHVRNTTGRPVHILAENHSCECTTVELEKRELPPGGSTRLAMSARVAPVYTKKDISCTLGTDDVDHPSWVYHLQFESFPDSRIEPDRIDLGVYSVADLGGPGAVGHVTPEEAWLEVFERPGGATAAPGSIQVPVELAVTRATEPEVRVLPSGIRVARYQLSISLGNSSPSAGTFRRTLNAPMEDGSGASALVSWTVRAPVNCAPPMVHFGSVAAGDAPIKQKMLISSSDGRTFRILSVDRDEAVTAEQCPGGAFPSPPAKAHEIQLAFQVPDKRSSRFLSGTLLIRIDRDDYPVVSVPWSAFLRNQQTRLPEHGGIAGPISSKPLSEGRQP